MKYSVARAKLAVFKHAFSSLHAFMKAVEVEPYVDDEGRVNRWRNEDLSPTPAEKQTWSFGNYVVFYFGAGFGNWGLGSALIGIGMSWWQAILAIFAAQMISSTAMYFNGRCGIVYKIGYPCVARAVFGMWGSFYFVAARAALALIWMGVQIYSGAALMDNMFRAILGPAWTSIPNHIPESQGITTARMLCFFLLWLVHLSLAHLRPYQLITFFWAKSILVTPAMLGLFIFCMANTKGDVGSLWPAKEQGGQWAWLFMYSINTGMGNTATYITNQPDMVRWANKKNAATWSQLVINPLTVTISSTLGILATSSINSKWGLSLWNQWDLMGAILDRYWSAGSRCGIALCAFCWMFYFLGINISGNMLPFGSDSTMLAPRFITIPRGNYFVTVAAWVIVPWKILASAVVFTQFLSGYGIFMGSVASIMIVDYWILTKGNVFIDSLYDPKPTNKHYYYHKGWNIQAVIAYVCGIALPFPGFVGTLSANVPEAATHLNQVGWLLSFFVAGVVYYAICIIWPTRNQALVKKLGLKWEQMSYDQLAAMKIEGEGVEGKTTRISMERKEVVEITGSDSEKC